MTEYTIHLNLGANYISLPALPANTTPDDIFGSEVNVWSYNISSQGWEDVSNVLCGKGYYAYAPKEKTITITGTDCIVSIDSIISIQNILLHDQYALIGPGATSINISGTPLDGALLKYAGNDIFEPTNILEVGKGYWLEKLAPSPTNFYIILGIMAAAGAAAFGIIRTIKK